MIDFAEKISKSMDLDFIEKKMSSDEFKEEEHPRDNSGKFTDKPGEAGAKSTKVKISDKNKSIAKKAAVAVAGTAAITLAILALRRSSVLRSQVDEVIKETDDIIKNTVKKTDNAVPKPAQSENVVSKPLQIEESAKKVEDFADITPTAKPKVEKIVDEGPKLDLDKDVGGTSSITAKRPEKIIDETVDKIFKTKFDKGKKETVEEFEKRISDFQRSFSERIKGGYWTEDNFIDPLFSLNRLKKAGDITSADYNRVISFYKKTNKELQKEIQYLDSVKELSNIDHKRLISMFNDSYYAIHSAEYKRAVHLGKIKESSPEIILYRKSSEDFFDQYAKSTWEIERIDKMLKDKKYSSNYKRLTELKNKLVEQRDKSGRVHKILNSDADMINIRPEDISGYEKEVIKENKLEDLANRYAKDYGIHLPEETKVADVGLTYESKPVRGAKKVPSEREQYRQMLKERIQRKYKKKTQEQIDKMVDSLMKREKGLNRDTGITTKAMSKEQFDEQEHPRDNSGRFSKKPGSGAKTVEDTKPKGSHGGFRQFSGRLPKNVAEAAEIQREKYKAKYPGASDQEITNRLVEYGEKRNKGADWYLYVSNREKYEKIQKQKMEDAAKSKRNVAYANGQPVDWRPPVNVKDSIREQSNKFRRDVAKWKSMKEASKKFMDKEASTQERNAARLILTVGTVATALGIAAMVASRPRLPRVAEAITPIFREGEKRGKNIPMWMAGDVDKGTIPREAKLFQFNKVVGENGTVKNPFREVQTANSFNKTIARFLAKTIGSKETRSFLAKNGEVSISFGPALRGYKGRFKLHDEYLERFVKDKETGKYPVYQARNSDMGLFNGQWFNMTSDGKFAGHMTVDDVARLYRAKFVKGKIPKEVPKGLKFDKDGTMSIIDSGKFKDWLIEKGMVRKAGQSQNVIINQEGSLFPSTIQRKWSEMPGADPTRKKLEEYGGYADFITGQTAKISNKILSILSLTPGTGAAMYYFSMDIRDAANTLKKERDRRIKEDVALSRGETPPQEQEAKKNKKKPKKQSSPPKTQPAEQRMENEPAETMDTTPEVQTSGGDINGPSVPVTDEEINSIKDPIARESVREALRKDGVREDIVIKGLTEETEEEIDIDITDAVALQLADDIVNVSQACKLAIESGMPGSDDFIQINNKLVEIYAALKDKAREN